MFAIGSRLLRWLTLSPNEVAGFHIDFTVDSVGWEVSESELGEHHGELWVGS